MSTTIMSACWPLQMPPTPKSVLISLADNSNDHGECWPSLKTISMRTCFSERAVQSAINWLEENGHLSADRSNGRHTRYNLHPDGVQPPQLPHPRSSRTPAAGASVLPQTPAGGAGVLPEPPQEVPSNHKALKNKSKSKDREVTFDEWVASLGDADAVPSTDPILRWAKAAGIPSGWIKLAWCEFEERFTGNSKKQISWPQTFRTYVRNGWLKIWYASATGGLLLTATGVAWQSVVESEASA